MNQLGWRAYDFTRDCTSGFVWGPLSSILTFATCYEIFYRHPKWGLYCNGVVWWHWHGCHCLVVHIDTWELGHFVVSMVEAGCLRSLLIPSSLLNFIFILYHNLESHSPRVMLSIPVVYILQPTSTYNKNSCNNLLIFWNITMNY